MSGPAQYTQWSFQYPDTTAGPRDRAVQKVCIDIKKTSVKKYCRTPMNNLELGGKHLQIIVTSFMDNPLKRRSHSTWIESASGVRNGEEMTDRDRQADDERRMSEAEPRKYELNVKCNKRRTVSLKSRP